jgi:hypothetical protein
MSVPCINEDEACTEDHLKLMLSTNLEYCYKVLQGLIHKVTVLFTKQSVKFTT